MENGSDYFYLIVMIIIGLSSFFRKKYKEKMADEKNKPVFEIPKSWEDFEKEFNSQKQKPVFQSIPENPNPTTITKPDFQPARSSEEIMSPEYETYEQLSYDTVDDFSRMRAKKTISKNLQKTISTIGIAEVETETVNKTEITLNNPDIAREAFIYSEIFHRKYN